VRVRVPILYGPCETLAESSGTSIVPALLRATPAAPVHLDHWAVRYPTHTADVASVIRQMTHHRLAGHPLAGVFHWSGNEPHTKYTLGLLMARILGVDPEALRPDDAPAPGAPRPRDAHLDTSRLDALGITPRTPLEPALWAILAQSRDR